MPKETNTGLAGAEPADTTAAADSSTAAETDASKAASSTEGEKPWHKDPRFKEELGLLKTAKGLLEKNGLESVDDLVDLVESGKKVLGKQVDLDRLDEILAKAKKMEEVEAYWKDQEEHKRRQDEDPEETVRRLESELKKRDSLEARKRAEQEQTQNAKRAIASYEREVDTLIHDLEVPKEQRGFVSEFFGVGNPCNDIDITDRKAVKRMVQDGLKKKEAYDQAVIKQYLESKKGLPAMTSTAGASAETNKPRIGLKEARQAFLDRFQNSGG